MAWVYGALQLPFCRLLLDTISLSPGPNPSIDLIASHAIAHQAERYSQLGLNVAVPRLVIEEQHLLVCDPAGLVDTGEMLGLVGGKDLYVLKVFQGTRGPRVGSGGVIGEGGDDVQGFEHVAREFGGLRTGRQCQWD